MTAVTNLEKQRKVQQTLLWEKIQAKKLKPRYFKVVALDHS